MQQETEVLGENLRGRVWIDNQIHSTTLARPGIEPGPQWWKAREQPLRQPVPQTIKSATYVSDGFEKFKSQNAGMVKYHAAVKSI